MDCKKTKNGVTNDIVYTSHLKWVPIGDQTAKMHVSPVFSDIIINKLRYRVVIKKTVILTLI